MEKHAARVEVEERQTGRHQRCVAPARTRKIREVAAAYHTDWIKRNTAAENIRHKRPLRRPPHPGTSGGTREPRAYGDAQATAELAE
jgi:hypothetical protein